MSRFLPGVFCIFIGMFFFGCPFFGVGGSVDLVINNHASDTVKDVWSNSYSERETKTILSGKSVTIRYDWPAGGDSSFVSMGFRLRGLEYGAAGEWKAEEIPERYKPDKRVKDGETVTVNIYDDRWEW